MIRQIQPEIALEVAARLSDWIPLSETRALRWATDLLEASPPKEPIESSVERIDDAARQAARATRDVRYHDVFNAMVAMVRREYEERDRAAREARLRIPSNTGLNPRTSKISVGIYEDITAKLVSAGDYDREFDLRREMTNEQVTERRRELGWSEEQEARS